MMAPKSQHPKETPYAGELIEFAEAANRLGVKRSEV